MENFGFQCKGWIESPLKGAEGNVEFLACFSRVAAEGTELSLAKDSRTENSGSVEWEQIRESQFLPI